MEAEPTFRFGLAALLYFVLSLVYFLPALLPGQAIYGSDFLAGGYMTYNFISERLAAGALPKWIPHIFGGVPIFANPASTYHPVHFLADLVLPTSRVLTVVFLVHFWVSGVGMYLLARELRCRTWVAFVAGIAYQWTGIIASWVYAGHDGRVIAATMAPLLFFLLHRGIRTVRLAPFAGVAATIGFALLSFQIQNNYYLLLAAAVWALFVLFVQDTVRRPMMLGKTVALGLGAVAYGFLLASVNFLPFLSYVPESPRGTARGWEYSTSYSMPEAELLSLAVPEQAGASVVDVEEGVPLFPAYTGENQFKLHTEYVGALVVVMLVLGAYYSRRNRYWWFFAGLGLFTLTIALGGNTPLYRLYYEVLPGTKQFRAPSLSFFVVALSLVVMAALTLNRLTELRTTAQARRPGTIATDDRLDKLPWIAGAVVALAMLGLVFAGAGTSTVPGEPTRAAGWGRFAFFAALVGGVLWSWTRGRIGTVAVTLALALITLTDLWIIDRRFFQTVPPPEELFAPDDVVSFLQAQPGPFRIWTFPHPQFYRGSGAYGGNYPMLFGLDQAGGEHGNQLQRWNEYLGSGTETYVDWHNFISRIGVVETPEGQALAFESAPGFLEAANIRYVVSMAPLVHAGFREVYRGSALVYENTQALPRAYLVPQKVEVPQEQMIAAMRSPQWDPRRVALVTPKVNFELPDTPLQGDAQVEEYAPDRVVVRTRANRSALLILADNDYQGWKANIDGRPAEVLLTNNTFRGVAVPGGEHVVTFVFDPDHLYTGLYITIGGFLLLGAYGIFLLVRRQRTEFPAEGA